jgi:hypothetical protein
MTSLEDVRLVASPQIVGPVTREMTAGLERERVTLRFRWTATVRRPEQITAATTTNTLAPRTGQ